jgi:hypothetical protein
MKLRLTQPGYETYTGQMGTVFFQEGLSDKDVKPIDGVRIAAQFLCEWENGTTASVAQSILDHAHMTVGECAKEVNADQALHIQACEAASIAERRAAPEVEERTAAYTAEELSKIADKDGIKGLRAIGDKLGIKSNSISEMMRLILEKQGE